MKILALVLCLVSAMSGGVLLLSGDTTATVTAIADPAAAAPLRFEIDPSRSKFMVKAHRGGLAWFKGHDHLIAVRDFGGEAELTPGAIDPASLRMTVNAASLEETSDVFTPQQKGIINKELKEIVLEAVKYPEITFRSTDISGKLKDGTFEVKIGGEITLHGVTRRINIPATVTLVNGSLHAIGKFDLDRSDFNVKATSAFHGLVRIKNKLTFTFDMVGRPV